MTGPKKIILLVIDTLRADHLGCYGYARNTSPNIDRLATESFFFSHAFTPVSYTLPAIASMLTSKRPDSHGIGFSQSGKLSEDADLTLAELLRNKGYATAAFVSTIVLAKWTRLDSGFDVYDDELTDQELNRPNVLLRDGRVTIARALDYIKQHKERDFFTFIHLMDVHGPYNCPPPYDTLFPADSFYGEREELKVVPDGCPCHGIPAYQVLNAPEAANGDYTGYMDDPRSYRARYDGGIRKCDDIIDSLLNGLKTLGIYDDTLIILTSDHGEALGENGVFFFHGVTATPDQISVPLLVKPPLDHISVPKKLTAHVSTMDIMPTILLACGIDVADLELHGSPLQPLIENNREPTFLSRTLIGENEYQYALIKPDHVMTLQKTARHTRGYYTYVPEVIDSLDGRQYDWRTGKELSIATALRRSKVQRLRQAVYKEPLSVNKLRHILYLLGSIVLPLHAKRIIMSLATRREFPQDGSGPVVSQAKPYEVRPVAQPGPNRPRLLHALANFCTGGSSQLVIDLIERLGDSYEQEVLTSYIPRPPAYVGVKISEIKQERAIEDFVAHLRSFAPTLVHVHYWGDCDHPWYAKVFQAAERYGCRIIENINTPVVPYFSKATSRYIYVSEYVRDHYGRQDAKSVVIHPGSNFELFSRSKDDPMADECIGMVYRLEPDKLNEQSIDPFIAVAHKRPSTKVLIVGDGTLLKPFQAAVRRAGVEDQFQFTGYVAYAELPKLYSRMAVFVAPVWQESFGQVTPFAMHMGIPVAGYDVGALSEILGDRKLLAPAGDSSALADLIIHLLDNSPKRRSIGRANQQHAAAQFSVESMIDKYRSLYGEVIGGDSLPVQNSALRPQASPGRKVAAQVAADKQSRSCRRGLKVALFVHCFFPKHFYGTETYTLQVAENLRGMGHEPVVVSAVFQEEPRQDRMVTKYAYDGIPVYSVDRNYARHSRILETYYHEKLRGVFINLLHEIQPDLVHVTHLINHTAVLLDAAEDLGLPTVATMTDFFGFCFNNRLQAVDSSLCRGPNPDRSNCIACSLTTRGGRMGRLGVEWPRLTASGLCAISHIPLLRAHRLAKMTQDLKARPDILASCYAKYRAAIMPSRFLREAYIANGLQTPCFDISFGVDLPRDPKPERLNGRPPAFGYIGQIAPHKGTDLLVDAFTRLPHGAATLQIYGPEDQDPGFMAKLKGTAAGCPVCFEGTFPGQRMAEILRDLDVLVIPSRWSENSPLVLLDALATHTPVIVSDTAGLTEFVQEGRNGFKFAVRSVDALEQVMRKFIENPKLAAQLSRSTEYLRTTRAMVEDVLNVYEFALDGEVRTRILTDLHGDDLSVNP